MKAIIGAAMILAVLASAAGADSGRFECRVDVGIGVLKAEPNLEPVTEERFHIGGCTLRDVETGSYILSTEIPAGCHLHSNDDGDIQADRQVYSGSGLGPGAELMAFCNAGVLDVTVAATLADSVCGDGYCDSLEPESCQADCTCAGGDQCWEMPPGRGCFCDAACVFGGDCCFDACQECGACETVACGDGICDANGNDCEADCGCSSYKACERGAPNDFRCYCDAACEEYGDCCPDYEAACGAMPMS